MKALVEAFETNSRFPMNLNHIPMDRHCSQVNIPENRGGLEYFEVGFIGKRLRGHPGIKQVDLNSRNVTPLGVADLVKGLIQNDKVEVLLLSSNPLGDVGCWAVAALLDQDTQLRALDISDTGCGRDGDTKLTSVFLGNNNTRLKVLDIIEIGQSIDVRNSRLFDYHMAFIGCRLKQGARVTQVNMSGCKSRNQSDMLDIEYLIDGAMESASLSTLILNNTKFGNEGAAEIARLLTYNQHLITLSINGNGIGTTADRLIQTALGQNTGLMVLNGVNMLQKDVRPSRLEHNFDVVFIRSRIGSRYPCRGLHLDNISNDGEKLGGAKHSSDSTVLRCIGECAFHLSTLDLCNNTLNENGLREIVSAARGNDSLRVLFAANGNSFSAQSSAAMKLMCSHHGCSGLVRADGIDLSGHGSDFSAKSHSALASANALYAYALVGNVLQQQTCTIRKFTFIGVTLRDMESLAEGFANNDTVESIILNKCKLDDDDVNLLLDALESNGTVDALDLEDCNDIGDRTGAIIGSRLEQTSVEKLSIDTGKMTTSGLKMIAEGVGNLTFLKLQHCNAGGWSYDSRSDPVRNEYQDDNRGISDRRNQGWVEIENAMPLHATLLPSIDRSYESVKSEQMRVRRQRRLHDEEEERKRREEEERRRREEEERRRREEERRRREEEERRKREIEEMLRRIDSD